MEIQLVRKSLLFFKTLILICVCSIGTNIYALDLGFDHTESDKKKHMAATAVLSTGTYLILRENKMSRFKAGALAFMFTMAMAYVKEDYFDETYSDNDMKANAVGSAVGVIIPIVFTF